MTRGGLKPLRLRTIMLLVNLCVLLVPLAGIYGFRIYENELVRQTESELIAQGAFIAALYEQAVTLADPAHYSAAAPGDAVRKDEVFAPQEPVLDLSHATRLPPRSDALATTVKPDAAAARAAEAIFPTVEDAIRTTLAGVRIVDCQGIVVGGRQELGLSLALVEEVAAALTGRYAAAIRQRVSKHAYPPLESMSRGSNIRVFVAMPIIRNGRVLGAVYLSRSPRNVLKALYDHRDTVAVAGAFVLGLTLALAMLTSYAISRPVRALIAQTERIGRGEKIFRPIDAPVTQELALLSEHIARMGATLAQRSDYIRQFALQLSHEFKTPLTAIQGATELIQEHAATMSREQLARFLGNTARDTERLEKLVTRLLEMARADMLEPRPESCELGGIVRNLQSRYRGSLSITAELQTSAVPLPPDIMETVLTNLLENSRRHGASEIALEALALPGETRITVADNGSGISPGNAQNLFVPFFTTNRDTGGTGLGLVIIRSLLNAYRASIEHLPSAQGARFVIAVPLTAGKGLHTNPFER